MPLGHERGQFPADVAFVGDDHLATVQTERKQSERDLALLLVGRSKDGRPGCAVWGGQEVQPHAPEPSRVAAAVAVSAGVSELGAPGGLQRATALHRVRELSQAARALDLLRVIESRGAALQIPTHARRIPDLELPGDVINTVSGTSVGSGRNTPSHRTVVSCNANPSRLCSPRRFSISSRSASSRKNTRSSSSLDGPPP